MHSNAPTLDSDAHLAAAIAREERRRGTLERLSELGMALSEHLAERAMAAPSDVEPRHDPARAFAQLSRAVRLTLVLEARSDERLLALRNGGPLVSKRAPLRIVPEAAAPAAAWDDRPCPEHDRVGAVARSAINAAFGEYDGAMDALDGLHERLTDRETRDFIASRPWRESVEAICADLGVTPDWSRWSEATGFTRENGKPDVKWDVMWRYDAKRAGRRRANGASSPRPDPHVRQ